MKSPRRSCGSTDSSPPDGTRCPATSGRRCPGRRSEFSIAGTGRRARSSVPLMRPGMRVLRALARDRMLTRLVAAYGLFVVCEYALWIAVLVYAYGRGGPTAAGVVAVAQLLPASVTAPLFAAGSDRWSPARVLLLGSLAQAACPLLMTVAFAAAMPDLVLYAGAVVAATCVAATRPTQTALLPALSRDVAALTAANVAVGWVESAGIVVAGALVGVGLATGGPAWVFGIAVVLLVTAA